MDFILAKKAVSQPESIRIELGDNLFYVLR
jgi:hypothetical protein